MAENVEVTVDEIIDITLDEIFGTGIDSVVQTITSADPGGVNEITVYLTNGNSYKFYVRNGTISQEQLNAWLDEHVSPATIVYVDGETLCIETNVVDGNGVSY